MVDTPEFGSVLGGGGGGGGGGGDKKIERPGKASKTRYLERVKDLDMEDLACR